MAFPDSTDSDPWPNNGTSVDHPTLLANTTTKLNLLVPRVSDSGWTTATLGNSWAVLGAPYATPGYRLKGGWTAVQGGMKSGTSATTVFTLPVGMRPLASKLFVVPSGSGTASIIVGSSGTITVSSYTTGGSNASVWLDEICFIAEQ